MNYFIYTSYHLSQLSVYRGKKYYFHFNSSSTKEKLHEKGTKTKTFVVVEALKRAVWNVLTMG